jgi:hypothetical protein
VLALIGEILRLIPFKTNSTHYNNITTNMQLRNKRAAWQEKSGQCVLKDATSIRGIGQLSTQQSPAGILELLLRSA